MLDFLSVGIEKHGKVPHAVPKFKVVKSKDLMIRGNSFYAIWNEHTGLWTTDPYEAVMIIDAEIAEFVRNATSENPEDVVPDYLIDSDSGSMDKFNRLCQKQMADNYRMLDAKIMFANDVTKKEDYVTKTLPYCLEERDTPVFDHIINTLYDPEEAHKIMWAIGVVLSGDIEKVHKFLVLYGKSGTGKSTILNIIDGMFESYTVSFDAHALGSQASSFALESFRSNPLVAIQQDGDLSNIDDNTRLNSLVAHEKMTVNEKHKSTYEGRFKCMLFMGTNKPVKITDPKSGLPRRVIDVEPSGRLLSSDDYWESVEQVKFEYGAIAKKCLDIYNADKHYYDNYRPIKMIQKSNDLAVFVSVNKLVLAQPEGITMEHAWEIYRVWTGEHGTKLMSYRVFRDEIQNYYALLIPIDISPDGIKRVDVLKGFEVIEEQVEAKPLPEVKTSWLKFDSDQSLLDKFLEECPAQYTVGDGRPKIAWADCKTVLADIDTKQEHFVIAPPQLIMVDFDLKENGIKSLKRNTEAASKFPPTYAELSRSGAGIHLHYLYEGDVTKLAAYQDENPDIEIKICGEKTGFRRRLTRCNSIPIATISSGLSLRQEGAKRSDMLNFNQVENEKTLRSTVRKVLNGEIDMHHKQGVEFINSLLEKAYESDISYDLRDLQNVIIKYAASSTHHAKDCLATATMMHYCSKNYEGDPVWYEAEDEGTEPSDKDWEHDTRPLTFYDIECFPNLFLVKYKTENGPIGTLINPTSTEIEPLLHMKLVGFNNRKYDNHMIYGCYLGYTNEQLYKLSKSLTDHKHPSGHFGKAYGLSYTDIYDFAAKKQSLKKWEIEMGIHHKELGLPWDKPVPEELWDKVAEYCDNDVIATEKLFKFLAADYTARVILAKATSMTPGDTTNTLSAKLIFGDEPNPQKEFVYRNMGDTSNGADPVKVTKDNVMFTNFGNPEWCLFDRDGRPVFPGYKFENGKSYYRSETIGEGGYVYSEPGYYEDVALLDLASMHPSSAIAECVFGPRFTKRFAELKQLRICVKHESWDDACHLLDGLIAPFVGQVASSDLAYALKIVINAVYGMTAAHFENKFKDPRNVDNIVAKRGELFMINLKHEVQDRGFTVVHIKTDSIKIANATPEIIQFCMDFAKMYDYEFEHEATYARMCLVNKAVYIAQYSYDDINGSDATPKKDHRGKWTATGEQFAVPYVYKSLFTHDDITFDDLRETKSVQKGAIYLDMNEEKEDVTYWENLKELRRVANKGTVGKKEMSAKAVRILEENTNLTDIALDDEISKGHAYEFVGRVGSFVPIKPGFGGGLLVSQNDDIETNPTLKFNSVTGAKGFRWMESENITDEMRGFIDFSYYDGLKNDAVAEIEKYVSFDKFVAPLKH